MELITYEEGECYCADTSEMVGISGRGRLTFEVRYLITNEAVKRGFADEQRKIAKQHCEEEMIRMLHEAITELEGAKKEST